MPMYSERGAIKRGLLELVSSLHVLCGYIQGPDQDMEARVEDLTGDAARFAAAQAYRKIEYGTQEDGRAVERWAGAVAASHSTMEAAERCNTAKAAFEATCVQVRRESKIKVESEIAELLEQSRELRGLLRDVGKARLHLLQAYRRIPVAGGAVLQLGFVYARGARVMEHVSREKAEAMLRRRGASPDLLIGVPDEALYRVRGVPPHWRVNVTRLVNGKRNRRSMHAHMPVLVSAPKGALPRITGLRKPVDEHERSSARRIDARISATPLVEGAPLFVAKNVES